MPRLACHHLAWRARRAFRFNAATRDGRRVTRDARWAQAVLRLYVHRAVFPLIADACFESAADSANLGYWQSTLMLQA